MHTRLSIVRRAAPRCLLPPALLLVLVAGVTACGSDKAATPSPTTAVPTTTLPATTTTQPASTDPAVGAVINDLLHQWDAALTSMLQEPQSALRHPDDEPWVTMNRTFTADSPYVRDLPKLLRSYADRGQANRFGPSGIGQRSYFVYPTDLYQPDSLNFVWCSFDDSVTYDVSTGAVVDDRALSTSGTGTALRQNGTWRIYRLRQLGAQSRPAGAPSDCSADLAAPPPERTP